MDHSDSEESGEDIIDLVIRTKDEKIDDSDVTRRTPLKQVLKAKKKQFEQPDSSGSDEDDGETKMLPQPKKQLKSLDATYGKKAQRTRRVI